MILTGATGMVGEGVLLACLASAEVHHVRLVSRRRYAIEHPKVSQLLFDDFTAVASHAHDLSGFDACFFCAGVSSVGKNEALYTQLTHALTLGFATGLARLNPGMRFVYVSGQGTDSSERGRLMWARVKGRTENDLMRLPFSRVYAFRPGLMSPSPGQQSLKRWLAPLQPLYPLIRLLMPKQLLSLDEVGRAMIYAARRAPPGGVCEIADIRDFAT